MTAANRARALALIAQQDGTRPMSERVCRAAVAASGMTGAGLSLIGGAQGHRVVVHGTDAASRRLEDLQATLGVGPCVESVQRGGPVLVPHLGQQSALRWPGFIEPALVAGIHAVFAFPLQVGAIQLGVLDLYRATSGGLTDVELADALVFADIATLILLDAPIADSEGEVPAGSEGWIDLLAGGDTAVHQASGMLMVQLGVTIDQAMLRLRAYAFVHDQTITAVAHDIVERRLRLDAEP